MATTGHELDIRPHDEEKERDAPNIIKTELRPMWHSAFCEHNVLPFRNNTPTTAGEHPCGDRTVGLSDYNRITLPNYVNTRYDFGKKSQIKFALSLQQNGRLNPHTANLKQ